MSRHNRNVRIALVLLGLVAGVVLGMVGGVWFAAPSVTDLRNACTADLTVGHAGVTPGAAPGPQATYTVDTTPATPAAAPQPTPRGQ